MGMKWYVLQIESFVGWHCRCTCFVEFVMNINSLGNVWLKSTSEDDNPDVVVI